MLRWTLLCAFLCAVLCTSSLPGQATISVPDDYDTIQDAIDNAEDGDTIEVDPGLYVENVDFGGKTLALIGIDGAEETTILGLDDTLGADYRSVITLSGGEADGTRIEGFTLALGSGASDTSSAGLSIWLGGGIFANDATFEVRECVLEDNGAGAIYAVESSLLIESCIICDNDGRSAVEIGPLSNLEMLDSTLEGNTNGLNGGGAFHCTEGTTTRIEDCVFNDNSGFIAGAALFAGDAEIIRTTFSNNVGVSGAAFVNSLATPNDVSFTDCVFSGNNASAGGGLVINTSLCTLTRCVFFENDGGLGGALFADGASAEVSLDRCTIANNTSLGAGAIQFREFPTPAAANFTLTNCIVWGNGDDPLGESIGTIDIAYSNVEGTWPGVGNIDEDPLFVDDAADDFALDPDSPSIDAGDPGESDPDGTVRDQGAIYFPQAPFFLRGDADSNGVVSPLLDSLSLLNWAFNGGAAPDCEDAADADDGGTISALTDSLALLQWGFGDQPPPPPPGPFECGIDPDLDDDGIGCETEPDCS